MIHPLHLQDQQIFKIMQNTLEFNEWMKKIKSNYYSDDRQITNAFEKLKKIANNKNYTDENNN